MDTFAALVQDPLREIQARLTVATAAGADPRASPADWGVVSDILTALASGAAAAIPLLTDQSFHSSGLKNHTLVRYVGMVQDQFEPEFYSSAYRSRPVAGAALAFVNTSYADVLPSEGEVDDGDEGRMDYTKERLPLFVVPMPTESAWVHAVGASAPAAKHQSTAAVSGQKAKRSLNDDDGDKDGDGNGDEEGDDDDHGSGGGGGRGEGSAQASGAVVKQAAKRDRQGGGGGGCGGCLGPHGSSSFTVGGPSLCCLVKLYESARPLKLNDVAEFVGVLEADPSVGADGAQLDMFDGDEALGRHPPASKVPRLHCLAWRALAATDQAPYAAPGAAPEAAATAASAAAWAAVLHSTPAAVTAAPVLAAAPLPPSPSAPALDGSAWWAACRSAALQTLAFDGGLGGDSLAAEYALLCLCGRVKARVDGGALGVISLNLSLPSPPPTAALAVDAFAAAAKRLVPRVAHVRVDSAALAGAAGRNAFPLLPRKDYGLNRLARSMLQLPAETAVIVDEAHLSRAEVDAAEDTAGEAGAAGRALSALSELASSQELCYDFQFYAMRYPTNHPLLLLSAAGQPSSVDLSCWLPVQPTAAVESSRVGTDEPAVRSYVAAVAACSPPPFAPGVAEVAENDFVRLRQLPGGDGSPLVSAKDFHRWLTLARLLAASHGHGLVGRPHWDRALEMENGRRRRCALAAAHAPALPPVGLPLGLTSPAAPVSHPSMPPPPHAPTRVSFSPGGALAMGDDE